MVTVHRTEAIKRCLDVLLENHPVKDRGTAMNLIWKTGLPRAYENVAHAAIREYKKLKGVDLEPALSIKEKQKLRKKAKNMTAQQVKDHIASIDRADFLFWMCWRQFKDHQKWQAELVKADFSIHFN